MSHKINLRRLGGILAATVWISLSEFIRNEILFKSYWVTHYALLGLTFPDNPINGAVWGLWSFLFAIALSALFQRFSFIQTIFWGWFMAFVLMWVVIGNMNVLPYGLLVFAVPLSILEVFGAVWLIQRIHPELSATQQRQA
ncbi:MAG TPA: hypothetical protein PLL64_03115 [Rhodothermales bacterium]|nr:hypothetical protein [Rhodothermales bacterium]HRR08355.1 hypothetical protein [Rhodothermales bacterium]